MTEDSTEARERVNTPDRIQERLDRGQQFNAYNSTRPREYHIGIGPVSDLLSFATARTPEAADYLVDVLRASVGQRPAHCRMADQSEEIDE